MTTAEAVFALLLPSVHAVLMSQVLQVVAMANCSILNQF